MWERIGTYLETECTGIYRGIRLCIGIWSELEVQEFPSLLNRVKYPVPYFLLFLSLNSKICLAFLILRIINHPSIFIQKFT